MKLCNRLLRLAAFLVLIACGAPTAADAGPFKNFFRRVRHAFNEPARNPSSHRVSHKTRAEHAPAKLSSTGTATVPPNERNTRSAMRSSVKRNGKPNLPYGTPVPGKQGLVTSPFAPESGYVDVHGVPPGTEVKDPYTGKSFLTP